jgi:hypothetical protein
MNLLFVILAVVVFVCLQNSQAQVPAYTRHDWTPAGSMAGQQVDSYGADEKLSLVPLPAQKRNVASGNTGDLAGVGHLKDREDNVWLYFMMKPNHGGPDYAFLEFPGRVNRKLNGLDDLGGLALIDNPYLAILFGDKRFIVNGDGKGDPNDMIVRLPSDLTEQLFNAEVVRIITKLADGSNLVMTFDTKAFHEKAWYSYAADQERQATIDFPLWNAPLVLQLGAAQTNVISYLLGKESGSDELDCQQAQEPNHFAVCIKGNIPAYQFYRGHLFEDAGECELSKFTCFALLNALLRRFDTTHAYKDIEDALNKKGIGYRHFATLTRGGATFTFDYLRGYVDWCQLDTAYAPPGAICMRVPALF